MKSRHSFLPIAVALAVCLWVADAVAQAETVPAAASQESRPSAHAGIATRDSGERPGTGNPVGTAQPAAGADPDSAAVLRQQALAAMEMLGEEIATLTALKHAQAALLAWNRGRMEADEVPTTFDTSLCNDPAIGAWCRLLPATFGTGELLGTGELPDTGELPGTPSPTAEESHDRD